MDTFEVLKPGPYTTIQDFGRYGYLRLGIPLSGAIDGFSLRAANLLVGNVENEACLEITLAGLRLRALVTTGIAITGADLEAKIDKNTVPLFTSLIIKKNQIIDFQRILNGCRAYLAITGGIYVPIVMGSKSTYIKGGLGGIGGRLLRKGDKIRTGNPGKSFCSVGRSLLPEHLPRSDGILRIIPGPQVEFFTTESIKKFFGSPYEMTPMADRMGVILKGQPLEFRDGAPQSIISEAVLPGSIQIPGNGLPIIVLVEQTLGGYPKLGSVISADIWKIGQAKPGDRFFFKEVSLKDAVLALRSMEEKISIIKEFIMGD
jgi:biotin-dependent carboxylase-like uncharacterized protein